MTAPIKSPIKQRGFRATKIEPKRYILDILPHSIQIIDRKWQYVYLNRVALRQNQQMKENFPELGKTIMECRPGIEHTPLFETIKKCLRFREPYSTEDKIAEADGNVRFFEHKVSPAPEGVLILSIDTTEKKKFEKNKAEFLALTSSEFRTPLASLKWTLNLLAKDPSLSENAQENLKKVSFLSERLSSLGENLFHISHIDPHKQSFAKKHSSLSSLINLSIKIFCERIGCQNFFKISLPKRKTPIFADPTLFAQSFENILAEAIEHGNSGADIWVRVIKKFGYYEISVRVKKSGIEKENDRGVSCPKNFRLFIAKAAAQANSGKVWCEEDGKNGINFFMSVPLVEY